jgi:hypothetical protein
MVKCCVFFAVRTEFLKTVTSASASKWATRFLAMRYVPRMKERRNIPHATHMGEIRNTSKILVGQPEGKRPFGRPRYGWEDKIKK